MVGGRKSGLVVECWQPSIPRHQLLTITAFLCRELYLEITSRRLPNLALGPWPLFVIVEVCNNWTISPPSDQVSKYGGDVLGMLATDSLDEFRGY